MQVKNGIPLKLNDYSNTSRPKLLSGISVNSKQKNVSFGQATSPQGQEEEKKGMTFKKFTNIAGVTLGVGAILIPLILNAKRPAAAKLAETGEKLTNKLKAFADKTETVIKKEAGSKSDEIKPNKMFRFGVFMEKIKDNNEELVNNVLYGIGTVVVMPLVILFSPFGKKKASKEDKMFAVARQPLSFATMFSMQLTMDKAIKKIMPNIIKSKFFESEKVQKAAKEGKLTGDMIKEVKYDDGFLKKAFEASAEKLGIDKQKIKDTFKLADEDKIKNEFKSLMAETKNSGTKAAKESSDLLKKYFVSKNTMKQASTALTIAANVLFSIPVGCTLLNVIYGKAMKTMRPQPPKTPDITQDNMAKGGIK